jgi:hypothetical protein
MSSKKIVHELSIEDLMALAAGAKSEEIVEKVSEAAKFIYDLNIKHGDDQVSSDLIYYTYKHWKGWDQKRQSKPIFFKDFKKYFEPHRVTTGLVYLLDPKPFDLSSENYWRLRKEIREAKAKKSKKSSGQS